VPLYGDCANQLDELGSIIICESAERNGNDILCCTYYHGLDTNGNHSESPRETSDPANRLVTAFEALIASKVASSASTASKNAPSNERPQAEPASMLKYKRVDEA
jgi:hypothetical protein